MSGGIAKARARSATAEMTALQMHKKEMMIRAALRAREERKLQVGLQTRITRAGLKAGNLKVKALLLRGFM